MLEGGDQDIPSTYKCVDHNNEDKEYTLVYAGNSDEDDIVNCPIFQGEEPKSGETTISVHPKSVLEDDLTIDLSIKPSKVKVLSENHPDFSRRLGQRRTGESYVAVFRINSADDEPSKSATELADDIFGIGSDIYNLVSGECKKSACYFSKLNLSSPISILLIPPPKVTAFARATSFIFILQLGMGL